MSITGKLLSILTITLLVTSCSGNFKTSDKRYRPIGQPPIVIENNQR